MPPFFTIGHSTRPITEFIGLLREAETEIVEKPSAPGLPICNFAVRADTRRPMTKGRAIGR